MPHRLAVEYCCVVDIRRFQTGRSVANSVLPVCDPSRMAATKLRAEFGVACGENVDSTILTVQLAV